MGFVYKSVANMALSKQPSRRRPSRLRGNVSKKTEEFDANEPVPQLLRSCHSFWDIASLSYPLSVFY